MTAKEIADTIKKGSPFAGGFDEWEAEEMIKDYARKKCKEQREKCAFKFEEHGYYPNSEEIIKSAPEPEME